MSHYYLAHYRYSGDEAFLRDQAYPFLRGVCEFMSNILRQELVWSLSAPGGRGLSRRGRHPQGTPSPGGNLQRAGKAVSRGESLAGELRSPERSRRSA
ncbi:MAG: hypothetical protein ACC645_28430 [Pirellulales bacterium]